MRIIIDTIPHEAQRYDTCGDWWFDADGNLHVKVSEMGDDDYAFLVGIHEVIEAWICRTEGVKEEDVSDFDKHFEKERAEGKHSESAEPGDDPRAPYRAMHFFATTMERMLAQAIGVDWKEYDDEVMNL